MAGQLRVSREHISRALQRAPQLRPYVLSDVKPTGVKMGEGSYGCVEELVFSSTICAGKRMFETLVDAGNEGADRMVEKYYDECRLLSELRHPNIVQFLGICFLDNSLPVLVMEKLDRNLDDLLEKTPDITLAKKCSILQDVARGLVYLHSRSPAVVHRDLTARNVLLNSAMMAKIADMGNSRIIDSKRTRLATMTKLPGTMVYMPPEAFEDSAKYGDKLDMFSFGHLSLFTAIQEFPAPLLAPNYEDPTTGKLTPRNELERRGKYMETLRGKFGKSHGLVQLITQCLKYSPAKRPSAAEALEILQNIEQEQKEKDLLQELKRMKGAEGRKLIPPTGEDFVESRGIRYNIKHGSVAGSTREAMILVSVGSEFPAGLQVERRVRDPAIAEKAITTHGRLPSIVTGLHEEAAADLMATASLVLHSSVTNTDLVCLYLDVPGKQRSKQYYLQAVEKFFKHCQQPLAHIVYMGHSEEGTGNWCFKDGTISFREIFDLYRKYLSQKRIHIQCDCCYSGQWTIDCAKTLDSLGIPPCGHRAREQGVLIKVVASCKSDQKAAEPCYSVESQVFNEDRTWSYYFLKKVNDTQQFCYTDFTRLVCCRGPDESCRSEALKNWTWEEAIDGKLKSRIHKVRGKDHGRPAWYIVLLSNKSEEYKERFLEQVKSGTVDVAKWGYVIQSGWGEDPPDSVREKISTWTTL